MKLRGRGRGRGGRRRRRNDLELRGGGRLGDGHVEGCYDYYDWDTHGLLTLVLHVTLFILDFLSLSPSPRLHRLLTVLILRFS